MRPAIDGHRGYTAYAALGISAGSVYLHFIVWL